MKCLGVDIGFGYTKVYDGSRVITFPTIVAKAVDAGGFRAQSIIGVDDERFYAGEDIKGEEQWYDTRTSDFVGSAQWTALLAQAIASCGFDTFENALILGLPASQYSNKRSAELVKGLKARYILTAKGDRLDLSNTEISIIPQGVGIFLKYVSDTDTDYKLLRMAIADMGFHTIDLITMYEGKYLNSRGRSFPLGISVLLDEIATEFSGKYHFFISRERAMAFVANRTVVWLSEIYELENIGEIIKRYCMNVAATINNYMEGQEFDIGIAGGGGIYILRSILKLKKKLSIVADCAAANAIGYWHYGIRKYGFEGQL